MNREIKFRVFSKQQNSPKIILLPVDGSYSGRDLINSDDWVVMQYTGLKDKNGKEIYEGDIVGVPYINPIGGIDDKYNPETIYPVIFEHGEFSLKRPQFNQSLKEWLRKEQGEYISNFGNRVIITDKFVGEVIGNIYQNKELLK